MSFYRSSLNDNTVEANSIAGHDISDANWTSLASLDQELSTTSDVQFKSLGINTAVLNDYELAVNGQAHFGDDYDGTYYGQVQITRTAVQPDNKHHLSIIRNGYNIAGFTYLPSSNTIGVINGSNNTNTNGVFITDSGDVGIGETTPVSKLEVAGIVSISASGASDEIGHNIYRAGTKYGFIGFDSGFADLSIENKYSNGGIDFITNGNTCMRIDDDKSSTFHGDIKMEASTNLYLTDSSVTLSQTELKYLDNLDQYLSTTSNPVFADLKCDNINITGTLNISSGISEFSSTVIETGDNLIKLCSNNTGDVVDSGWYSLYNDGTDKYRGLFFDTSSNCFSVFTNTTTEPTTTVSSFNYADFMSANVTCDNLDIKVSGNGEVGHNIYRSGTKYGFIGFDSGFADLSIENKYSNGGINFIANGNTCMRIDDDKSSTFHGDIKMEASTNLYLTDSSVTLSQSELKYLDGLNQSLSTTSDPTFGDVKCDTLGVGGGQLNGHMISVQDTTDYNCTMVLNSTDQRLILGAYWRGGYGQYAYIQGTNGAETGYTGLYLNPLGGDTIINNDLTVSGSINGYSLSDFNTRIATLEAETCINYEFNQNLTTTSSPTFADLTVTSINSVTSTELSQIANINSNTISNTQWGYLGNLDQGLTTTSNVLFSRLWVLGLTPQMTLFYDGSNYTEISTSSGGDCTIAPSGGDVNVTGTLVASANVKSPTLTALYDSSNYATLTSDSSGNLTMAPTSGASYITGNLTVSGTLSATINSISSGFYYTPTYTNISGFNSLTNVTTMYHRVYTTVQYHIRLEANVTLYATTAGSFYITVPINPSSTFPSGLYAAGPISGYVVSNGHPINGYIEANSTVNKLKAYVMSSINLVNEDVKLSISCQYVCNI